MVAHDMESLTQTLSQCVVAEELYGGRYICPYCKLEGLTEIGLWRHCPSFHINWPNDPSLNFCPICRQATHDPLQVIAENIVAFDTWCV